MIIKTWIYKVSSIFPTHKTVQQVSHIGFDQKTIPTQHKKIDPDENESNGIDFPSVPSDNMPNKAGNNSKDSYDDLAARFNNLKKK